METLKQSMTSLPLGKTHLLSLHVAHVVHYRQMYKKNSMTSQTQQLCAET